MTKPTKSKLTPAEQHRRFKALARELEVDETAKGEERAFGKVGLRKPKKKAKRK
jgi:hypothetical protein